MAATAKASPLWRSDNLAEIFGSCKSTTEVICRVDEILVVLMHEQRLPRWTSAANDTLKMWTKEIINLDHISSALKMLRLVTSYAHSKEAVDVEGMINIYQLLNHFAMSDALVDDLHVQNEYWEILNKLFLSLTENHEDVMTAHLYDVGTVLISTIVNPTIPILLKIIRLKELNELLKLSPVAERTLFRAQVKHHFKKLPKMLKEVGDYDFQASLVEAIFRFTSISQRSQEVSRWFPALDCTIQSLFIRIKDFDPDCRRFLNAFNNSLGTKQKVFSFPCERAAVGQMALVKPKIASYEKFWIDFNLGTQSMLILCQKDWLGHSSYDTPWESIMIKMQDVTKVTVTRTVHSFSLEFVFPSVEVCEDLFFSQMSEESMKLLSNHIVLEFSPLENLVKVCRDVFQKKVTVYAQEPEGWITTDSRMNSSMSGERNKLSSSSANKLGSSSVKRKKSSTSINMLRSYKTSTSDPQTDVNSDRKKRPSKRYESSHPRKKHKSKRSPSQVLTPTDHQQGAYGSATSIAPTTRERAVQASEEEVIPCSLTSQEQKKFSSRLNFKTSVNLVPITRKMESVTQADLEVEILSDCDNIPDRMEGTETSNHSISTDNRGQEKRSDLKIDHKSTQNTSPKVSVTEVVISTCGDMTCDKVASKLTVEQVYKSGDENGRPSPCSIRELKVDKALTHNKDTRCSTVSTFSSINKTSSKTSPSKKCYPALEFTSPRSLSNKVHCMDTPTISKQILPINRKPTLSVDEKSVVEQSTKVSPLPGESHPPEILSMEQVTVEVATSVMNTVQTVDGDTSEVMQTDEMASVHPSPSTEETFLVSDALQDNTDLTGVRKQRPDGLAAAPKSSHGNSTSRHTVPNTPVNNIQNYREVVSAPTTKSERNMIPHPVLETLRKGSVKGRDPECESLSVKYLAAVKKKLTKISPKVPSLVLSSDAAKKVFTKISPKVTSFVLSSEFEIFNSVPQDVESEETDCYSTAKTNKDDRRSANKMAEGESAPILAPLEKRKSPSSSLRATLKILADYPVKPPILSTPTRKQTREERSSEQKQAKSVESKGASDRPKKRKANTYPLLRESKGLVTPVKTPAKDGKTGNSARKKKLFDTSTVEIFEASPPSDKEVPVSPPSAKEVPVDIYTFNEMDDQLQMAKNTSPKKLQIKSVKKTTKSLLKDKIQLTETAVKRQKKNFFKGKIDDNNDDGNKENADNMKSAAKRKNAEINRLSRESNTSSVNYSKFTKRCKVSKSPFRKSNISGGFLEFPEIQDSSPRMRSIYSDFSSSADTEHSWLYKKKSKKSYVSKTYISKGKSFNKSRSKTISSDDEWSPFKERKRKTTKERVVSSLLEAKRDKLIRPVKGRSCKKMTSYIEKSTDFETDVGSGNRSKSKEVIDDGSSHEVLRRSESSVDSGTPGYLGFRLAKKIQGGGDPRNINETDESLYVAPLSHVLHKDITECFGFSSELEICSANDSIPDLNVNQRESCASESREKVTDITSIKGIKPLFTKSDLHETKDRPPRDIPNPKDLNIQNFTITEISEIQSYGVSKHVSPFGGPLQSTLIQDEDFQIASTGRFSYIADAQNDSLCDQGSKTSGVAQTSFSGREVTDLNSQFNLSVSSAEETSVHPFDVMPRENTSTTGDTSDDDGNRFRREEMAMHLSRDQKRKVAKDSDTINLVSPLVSYQESLDSVELFSDEQVNGNDVPSLETRSQLLERNINTSTEQKASEPMGRNDTEVAYTRKSMATNGKSPNDSNSKTVSFERTSLKTQDTGHIECKAVNNSANAMYIANAALQDLSQLPSQRLTDDSLPSLPVLHNVLPLDNPLYGSQSFSVEPSKVIQPSSLSLKASDLLDTVSHTMSANRHAFPGKSPVVGRGSSFVSPDTTYPMNEALSISSSHQGTHITTQAAQILSVLDKLTNNAFQDLAGAYAVSPTSHISNVHTPVRPHPRQLFFKGSEREPDNHKEAGISQLKELLTGFSTMRPDLVEMAMLVNRLSETLKKVVSSVSSLSLCVDEVKTTLNTWLKY